MVYSFGGYGLYILFGLPALLLGLWAQFKVKSAFKRFSRIRTNIGLSGSQIARRMLDNNNLNNVEIEVTRGLLSDHYDPSKKTLRLSPDVYNSNSIAAAGIAAHEAGHAIQDSENYAFLQMRTLLIPTVKIGSWVGPIIFMIGLMLATSFGTQIAWAGLIIFAATAVFTLITLPVEFDATRKAKAWLSSSGMIHHEEMAGINSVLNAAALTYVAAAAQAISTILYYAFLLTGRSRRD